MGAPVPWAPAVCCTPTRRWDASSVHVPSLARGEASYLAGIFARFRAMASSTAFSCFNSSSRRDSVLLGLLEPEPEPDPDPGRAGLPDGAAGPLPDDLGGGDRGRFLGKEKSKLVQTGWESTVVTWSKRQTHLSPWGGTGRGPCPRGRSMRGDSGDRRGIRFSRPTRIKKLNVAMVTAVNGHQPVSLDPTVGWDTAWTPGDARGRSGTRVPPRSGEKAILLLGGEPGRFLSEDRYLFLLLSACCCCQDTQTAARSTRLILA